jgi:hypothetical protein
MVVPKMNHEEELYVMPVQGNMNKSALRSIASQSTGDSQKHSTVAVDIWPLESIEHK